MRKFAAGAMLATVLLTACQVIPLSGPRTDSERVTAAPSEAEAWAIASQAKEAAALHAYLARFPEGEHQSSAQLRLMLIQKGAIK